MAADAPQYPVLYMDLLGFSSLVETSPQIAPFVPAFSSDGNPRFDAMEDFHLEDHPAARMYWNFYRTVDTKVQELVRRGAITAGIFSDSAFIVMHPAAYKWGAMAGMQMPSIAMIACDLMRTFILRRVPVRMGIAVGTFQRIRFRADTLSDSGIYTSQFYGTGVMNAYKTEHTSGKGMRIFVHSSAEEIQNPANSSHIKVLPLREPTEHSRFELEYLHRRTDSAYEERLYISPPTVQPVWDAVVKMQSAAPQRADVQEQYVETLKSLNAMQALFDKPPFA